MLLQSTSFEDRECIMVWRRPSVRPHLVHKRPNLNLQDFCLIVRPARESFTIAGERQPNLDLCWALRAFEQGCIFIIPHLL
jgi:hypothetical protein